MEGILGSFTRLKVEALVTDSEHTRRVAQPQALENPANGVFVVNELGVRNVMQTVQNLRNPAVMLATEGFRYEGFHFGPAKSSWSLPVVCFTA
jgi:hypothetical protein